MTNQTPLLNTAQTQHLKLQEETRFVPNGIVSRTLLQTVNSRVILFGISAGHELSEHTSTYRAIVQVLSGSCDFSVSGTPYRLSAGHLLHMPPNAPHGLVAREECSMLLTLIKDPVAGSV